MRKIIAKSYITEIYLFSLFLMVLSGCTTSPKSDNSSDNDLSNISESPNAILHKALGPKGIAEVVHKLSNESLNEVNEIHMFKEGIKAFVDLDNDIKITENSNVLHLKTGKFEKKFDLNEFNSLNGRELSHKIGDLVCTIINVTSDASLKIKRVDQNTLESVFLERAAKSTDNLSGYIQDFRPTKYSVKAKPLLHEEQKNLIEKVDYSITNNILYMRIPELSAATTIQFTNILNNLKHKYDLNSIDLILDLRGNPGGSLHATKYFLNSFIDNSLLMTIKKRPPILDEEIAPTPGTKYLNNRIVILTDGNTSSGSEILLLSLRKVRKAWIIGSRTYGSSSLITYLPLKNGNALRVVTGRMLASNGTPVPNGGIIPDECTSKNTVNCEKTVYKGKHGSEDDKDFIAAVRYLNK